MKPRASGFVLGRQLLGCAAVTADRIDGVLRPCLVDVDLSPPDKVAARPELRPVATGREDDLEIGHFGLLLDSPAYRWNGSVRRGAGENGRSGVGRQIGPLNSRLRLSPARRGEVPTYGGLSWNSGRQLLLLLACPCECLSEPREHHKVGVKPNALQATDAKRSEAVIVLQSGQIPALLQRGDGRGRGTNASHAG
jgi:hypothetical protein